MTPKRPPPPLRMLALYCSLLLSIGLPAFLLSRAEVGEEPPKVEEARAHVGEELPAGAPQREATPEGDPGAEANPSASPAAQRAPRSRRDQRPFADYIGLSREEKIRRFREALRARFSLSADNPRSQLWRTPIWPVSELIEAPPSLSPEPAPEQLAVLEWRRIDGQLQPSYARGPEALRRFINEHLEALLPPPSSRGIEGDWSAPDEALALIEAPFLASWDGDRMEQLLERRAWLSAGVEVYPFQEGGPYLAVAYQLSAGDIYRLSALFPSDQGFRRQDLGTFSSSTVTEYRITYTEGLFRFDFDQNGAMDLLLVGLSESQGNGRQSFLLQLFFPDRRRRRIRKVELSGSGHQLIPFGAERRPALLFQHQARCTPCTDRREHNFNVTRLLSFRRGRVGEISAAARLPRHEGFPSRLPIFEWWSFNRAQRFQSLLTEPMKRALIRRHDQIPRWRAPVSPLVASSGGASSVNE